MNELAASIRDELQAELIAWSSILGVDRVEELCQIVEDRAGQLAAILTSGDDDETAELVVDILNIVKPEPDDRFWTTPLGLACAASTGSPLPPVVSMSVAAAWLGVSKPAILKMVRSGRLEQDPATRGVRVGSLIEEAIRRRST